MHQETDILEVSDLLLDLAITLMASGAHTSRVVRNVARAAESFGYSTDLTVFQMSVLMTLTRLNDSNVRHTAIRKIKPMALNFRTISNLSALTWSAYDNKLPLEELKEEFNDILNTPRMSRWLVLFLVACANAAFCRLFTGDIYAMLFVFAGTLVAFFMRQEMLHRHINHFVVFITCAFVSSMIAGISYKLNIGTTPDVALATSVLFLIPGVPMINSIIDILEGHVLAGTSRLINATNLIICIALGLFITLQLLGVDQL
ncbi:MAG: threonine/serine exporter family protein [Bacteroidales bacterium]|nr:threonine/serine exporter family protein [Bacteroidales bacterium]